MLVGCDTVTADAPMDIAAQDGIEPTVSTTHSHLVLSAMCTINPHGRRINDCSQLSLKQRLQVLRHIFQCLWIAACLGIHYRDINTGNILHTLVKHLDPQDQTSLIGYLIDYGNARILDQRRIYTRLDQRMHGNTDIQLRLDDARSANLLFLSTRSTAVLQAHQRYTQAAKALTAENQRRAQADKADKSNETWEEDLLTELESDVKEAEKELGAIGLHRYIDDLESAIYAHVFQVSIP